MKISLLANSSRMAEREPATLGHEMQTTSVSITAKFSSRRISTALSTSDTIRRRIPKSVVSAMLNACILMPFLPKILVTSLILPVLFSRKTESCLIVIIFFDLIFHHRGHGVTQRSLFFVHKSIKNSVELCVLCGELSITLIYGYLSHACPCPGYARCCPAPSASHRH